MSGVRCEGGSRKKAKSGRCCGRHKRASNCVHRILRGPDGNHVWRSQPRVGRSCSSRRPCVNRDAVCGPEKSGQNPSGASASAWCFWIISIGRSWPHPSAPRSSPRRRQVAGCPREESAISCPYSPRPSKHDTPVVESPTRLVNALFDMTPMRAPLEFSVSTPLGFLARCTRSRWRWGILPEHPVLDGRLPDVARTFAFPRPGRRVGAGSTQQDPHRVVELSIRTYQTPTASELSDG